MPMSCPRWSAFASLALLLLLLLACAPRGTSLGDDPAADAGMYPHFFRVGLVQSAVIHGSLEEVREPARWLARQGGPSRLPPGSEPLVRELRAAAAAAAEADDLQEAARATAAMASVCGRCHRAYDGGPGAASASRPRVADQLPHIQAAERLWLGLIAPSDEAWRAGARQLSQAPFVALDPPPAVAEMVREAQAAGVRAATLEDQDERGALFGELLSTCAGCHQRVGVTTRM